MIKKSPYKRRIGTQSGSMHLSRSCSEFRCVSKSGSRSGSWFEVGIGSYSGSRSSSWSKSGTWSQSGSW